MVDISSQFADFRKCYAISSSIANFTEKLEKRYADYLHWDLSRLYYPTIFFGLYHVGDFTRFLAHRGKRTVFWCGSDIISLQQRPFWQSRIANAKATHYCENAVEYAALSEMGIQSEIHPMIFASPNDYPVTFTSSDNPKVFLCVHKGRESEYGLDTVVSLASDCPGVTFHVYGEVSRNDQNSRPAYPKNVVFHGRIPEEQFNREIRGYHAGLRLNSFDGFGEITAKSILLGQYPISTIPYPHIVEAKNYAILKESILALCQYKKPNPYRDQWYQILKKRVEA